MKQQIAIVFAVLVTMNIRPAMAQQSQAYDDRPKITVSGESIVNVEPDKVVIALGIETWDLEIMEAKEKNNEIMNRTLTAIRELGVPQKEIQTDHLSIEPRYKDNYEKEDFIGFFVRNSLVVTLDKMNTIEELVTKALQSGVNYIHGVDFQTTEFKKYREQARELALKAAKEKADKMAHVLGQSARDPVQISESYTGYYGPNYSGWSGWRYGRNQGMSQNVIQNVEGGSGELYETIALGKISIRASVSVTFELRPY